MPSARSKGFIAVAVAAAVGAGAMLHYGGSQAVGKEDASKTVSVPSPFELAAVDVTTVKPGRLVETIRVSGQLKPVARATIRAKVSGTLLEVLPKVGERVLEGDVLARFETENLEATVKQQERSLESARAQLLLAEQALEKAEELAKKGITSRSTLEKAQSDVATSRASVRGLEESQLPTARRSLEDAVVRAPFDGVVSARNVETGENASSGAELFTIVDVTSLEAEVLVPTRDVGLLKPGQEVSLVVEGAADPVSGKVDRVSPVANDGSRAVPVFIRIANDEGRLWGGMFASGEIEVRSAENAIAIPAAAVRTDDEGKFVLKFAEGKLERQAVEVGADWKGGALIQVTAGLISDDVVVSAPVRGLKAGDAAIVSAR